MENSAIVLFGATGDLSRRKLIPALYRLYSDGKLNQSIMCLGREDISLKDFIELIDTNFIKNKDPDTFKKFVSLISYLKTDLDDTSEFKKQLSGIKNKTFYLSIPAEFFKKAVDFIRRSEVLKTGNNKIAIEKPFGYDFKSSEDLNDALLKAFKEEEIFRMDHYLGKTMVRKILELRTKNPNFERMLNSRMVDRVDIIISEKSGIENRGLFYEKTGAIRDVIQNHSLQMLSLLAMELTKLNTHDIDIEKPKVLNLLKKPKVMTGQYLSYKNENYVDKNSKTETYADVECEIKNKRWEGTKFHLITGKKLKDSFAEIRIKLKPNDYFKNDILIRIQPEPWTNLEPDKKHKDEDAYEVLFKNLIDGDKTLFVDFETLRASWRFIDEVEKSKKENIIYKDGIDLSDL